MDDMTLWMKTWWPIVWAAVLSFISITQMLLSKTYARKEDVQQVKDNVEAVSKEVKLLEAKVEAMPTQQQITELLLEMANTRGQMKELRAQIQPVQHLSQLLLEQRLKDDK